MAVPEKPKPSPVALPPLTPREKMYMEWAAKVPIAGGECSMIFEDKVEEGASTYYRVVMKSECTHPVAYTVAMFVQDWESLEFEDIDQVQRLGCTDFGTVPGEIVRECGF